MSTRPSGATLTLGRSCWSPAPPWGTPTIAGADQVPPPSVDDDSDTRASPSGPRSSHQAAYTRPALLPVAIDSTSPEGRSLVHLVSPTAQPDTIEPGELTAKLWPPSLEVATS